LAEAVYRERQETIAAHWGVPIETVSGWHQALHPATPKRVDANTTTYSLADIWAIPSRRQFSLLDLVYWTFWMAVLSALVRLTYDHTLISDKWHIATTSLAASVTLAAAWGYAKKVRSEAGLVFRIGVIFALGLIGLLLIYKLSDANFSGLELMALALGNAAVFLVGFKIGSR
jgi:hypothetical protein